MKIKEWFDSQPLSYRKVAAEISCNPSVLFNAINKGRKIRDMDAARRLCAFTGGKVTMAELYGVSDV